MNYKVLLLGVAVIAVGAFVAYTTINPTADSAMDMSQERTVSPVEDVILEDNNSATESSLNDPEAESMNEDAVVEVTQTENNVIDTPPVTPVVTTPIPAANTSPVVITTESETVNMAPQYTLAEVAEHAVESDCWTAVNGQVYDLTDFIRKHPGGKANIIRICGIDGTAAFERQHGGSNGPENTLAGYEIGTLK
jgi:cytochrome b involved in lipid metabolism